MYLRTIIIERPDHHRDNAMYTEYFGLKEFPFSLASDPRFLYLSPDHARVKAYIDYAINVQDSFVVFTGEIGAGKTTLVNDALVRNANNHYLVRIQATNLNTDEFLQVLLLEFGIKPYQFSKVQMLQTLKEFLLTQFRKGKKVFLIIDEAQKLDKKTLESIRYLSDMEIGSFKPLGVILVGQPELNELIDRPDMEHIRQRIRLRFHIKSLNSSEVGKYIRHRLTVAGMTKVDLFNDECIAMIQQYSQGCLRLINTLCDYSLMHCFVEKLEKVTPWVIQQAANELGWEPFEKQYTHKKDITRFNTNKLLESNHAKLTIKKRGQIIAEYELSKECVTIGRHASNDIPLEDSKASRYHAQILCHADGVYLHDLNSTNGTFLSNHKITVHALTNGEMFSIGEFTFAYSKKPEANKLESNSTQELLEKDGKDDTQIRPRGSVVQLVHSRSVDIT